jgi:uncharacterized protein
MTNAPTQGWFKRWSLYLFFILAVVYGTLAIPMFALWGAAGQALVENTGIIFRTSYIVAAQIFFADPRTGSYIFALIFYPFTPTLAALTICVTIGGWPAVRQLLARLRPWQSDVGTRSGLVWWAIATGTLISILLCIAVIRSELADAGAFSWNPGAFGLMPPLAWFVAAMFTDGGGWGEELGWRGFALPLLQSCYSPLKSAIILGAMWSAWHWNVRILDYGSDPIGLFLYLINFTASCIAITIIMTFFSNKVGGSALMAIMIHGLANDSIQLKGVVNQASDLEFQFWSHFAMNLPYYAVAILLVLVTSGQLGFNAGDPGRQRWIWPQSDKASKPRG